MKSIRHFSHWVIALLTYRLLCWRYEITKMSSAFLSHTVSVFAVSQRYVDCWVEFLIPAIQSTGLRIRKLKFEFWFCSCVTFAKSFYFSWLQTVSGMLKILTVLWFFFIPSRTLIYDSLMSFGCLNNWIFSSGYGS